MINCSERWTQQGTHIPSDNFQHDYHSERSTQKCASSCLHITFRGRSPCKSLRHLVWQPLIFTSLVQKYHRNLHIYPWYDSYRNEKVYHILISCPSNPYLPSNMDSLMIYYSERFGQHWAHAAHSVILPPTSDTRELEVIWDQMASDLFVYNLQLPYNHWDIFSRSFGETFSN